MLAIDSHLDLATNALEWDRDLKQSAFTIRQQEEGMTQQGRGKGMVCLPELRQGEVFLCLATVLAGVRPPGPSTIGFTSAMERASAPEIAYAYARGQLAYYRALEEGGLLRPVHDRASLDQHYAEWQHPTENTPLGYILSMEGADPVLSHRHLSRWHEDGLRVVGPALYGLGRYSHGTGSPGGLTMEGRDLLGEMARLGVILDVTHLAEAAFWEALELYRGPVLASHSCCQALVPGDRQLSDEQIGALVERGAVIGVAMDAWMLQPGWERGVSDPKAAGVGLDRYLEHVDHICQLTGNAGHTAIGSDLDGGFGQEQSPYDLETIADFQRIPARLRSCGYVEADVEAVMHGNWLRFFREAWG